MKVFLGLPDSGAEPAGAYSWQHLTFVTTLVLIMAALAVIIGLYYRRNPHKNKNVPLIWAAILIDSVEIFKIVLNCTQADDPVESLLRNLPLFLCSIQLITIPLAAFSKGKLKDAALDFVLVFGLLGALAGTYGAAQNYSAYPIFHYVNVTSGITHCISGFGSLYIAISGMASMKKSNIGITFSILSVCCILAYVVNVLTGYTNYMFLMQDDGTPYSILTKLVGENAILYPLGVVILFLLYIAAFYFAYFLITKIRTAVSETLSEV